MLYMPLLSTDCNANKDPVLGSVHSAAASIRLGQPKCSFSRCSEFQESSKSQDAQSLAPKHHSGSEDKVSLLGIEAQLSLGWL